MKKKIDQYEHRDKGRLNNPPVGLVTPETDKDTGRKTYSYDPHIDPSLQWAGKAEHTSFEIPTVSLHVHERIDPLSIIEAVKKKNGDGKRQMSLFSSPEENPPLRQAIDFYKHKHNWSNRLIAGDSLLVMNSLLEKEGMAGQIQMIYIDPPYGIKYGSNFQPFVNKRDVKDGKDEDLTAEPEQILAFRDTWELGIHSYLTYLRDRLLLARELLTDSGSVFVQISDENLHLVRCLLDEVFDNSNFVALILYRRGGFQTSVTLPGTFDYILWYAKSLESIKFHPLYVSISEDEWFKGQQRWYEIPNGAREKWVDGTEPPLNAKVFSHRAVYSASGSQISRFPVEFDGFKYYPPTNRGWSTNEEGFERLKKAKRLMGIGNSLRFLPFYDDFPFSTLTNGWFDTVTSGFGERKVYIVQTGSMIVERCLLMTTDPGDLVFDPTCGSGTTAYVAEQWGRRWITCDTSRVSITLAKQRLMTANYDYYNLARPDEGVGSGFKYETVPHVTLKSIANNEPPTPETLYDRPSVDTKRTRVTGPFTVEAVPAPMVIPLSDIEQEPAADDSIARSGATLRHVEWKDELLRTGIRGKNGQYILFSRIETLPGTRWLHAEGETKPNDKGADSVREDAAVYGQPQRVVISFGPEHAPLEQRQVELAIGEVQTLVPRPSIIVFAAFQFDPEAAKDIDETKWPGVTLLKAQMNADLLTEDLKKKRASNDSFWLMGQPDVRVIAITDGADAGKYRVEVHGFDYYNTRTGNIESGSVEKIALWMLDTDYDGRSLFPKQVFFPMAGEKDGWSRLKRTLRAEIDEDLIDNYHGTTSLPFASGDHKKIAVKIVDDRGIESLKIINLT
jgi:adenine-specific DNA-methyltransferase